MLIIAGLTYLEVSCTEIIPLDLNSASPALVVDGEITNQAGPYTIRLSQSVNFSDSNIFPPLPGATVTISDNEGNSETLSETTAGQYSTAGLKGTPGKTYKLSIVSGSNTYESISKMYPSVPLDRVEADTTNDHPGDRSRGYQVNVQATFTDVVGEENYYRLVPYINGEPRYTNITVISDYLQDGSVITTEVARGETIKKGDRINIVLQSIDKDVFKFFNTLKETTRTKTGITAAVPGNPVSNITNNALGFFSAHAISSKEVIAP